MLRTTFAVFVVAAFALLAAPYAAYANNNDDRADQLYAEGKGLVTTGAPGEARERFAQSCDLGHPRGCADAGAMWAIGEGGPADTLRAKQLFEQMCAMENWAHGCKAAELIGNGAPAAAAALDAKGERLFAEDDKSGLNYSGLACRMNHVPACLRMARETRPRRLDYFDSEGHEAACAGAILCTVDTADFMKERNNPEIVSVLNRACRLGSGEGCFELGKYYSPLGLFGAPSNLENWHLAMSGFRRACEDYQVQEGCERYRHHLEHQNNPHTKDVPAWRETRCAEGDQYNCDIVAAGKKRATATLDPLLCAQVLYLVRTDGPQFVERATREAKAAVAAHVAAKGGDQLQLEIQVMAAARSRLQAIQSGAESPQVVRQEIAACRKQFGFEP